MEITLEAGAKINLSLDVLSKRSDGYHEVAMIMQEIGLCDGVTIKRTGCIEGITLKVLGNTDIPEDKRNTAFKAAELVRTAYGIEEGIFIKIIKKIPCEAGMAGGSTDAAAVIKGINKLFDLKMTLGDMISIGKKVGADVPFCIMGKTAIAEGIGEILTPLPSFSAVNIVVAKPDFGVSTPLVYKSLDAGNIKIHPNNEILIEAIKNKDINSLAQNMYNVLQPVTMRFHNEIQKLIDILLKAGATGAMMSGSGPSVFGIFQNEEGAQKGYDALKNEVKYRFITKTI